MKKIILSAASLAVAAVASVSVAPTTSEAIPAFARQTGSACLACHFQSFPTLSSYGRAFKMGAMTDSARDLVEDEHLSIPATLNWTVMTRPNFFWNSKETAGTTVNSRGYELADQVFMVGGRGGEHTGVFIEAGFGVGGGYGNMQMFNSWDMGDMKVGATVWNDGFGEDSGMQLMSVWGQHGGMLGGKSVSGNGAMAAGDAGVTFFAGTDEWAGSLGFVNFNGGADLTMSPVLRGNYFLNAGDWEVGLGLISVSGKTQADEDTKRTGLDAQAFGEVNDMQIGIFADLSIAPSGGSNIYNGGTKARVANSVRVSVKPIAQWIFLAGLGSDKTTLGTVDTTVDTTIVGVEYEMYQNFAIQLVRSSKDDGTTKDSSVVLDLELLI
ncbi:MAG: hypothetical protein R8M14_05180 [Ghiorsea sp.]